MASCLTQRFSGKTAVLHSPCRISAAYAPGEAPNPPPTTQEFQAIWDTGATGSVITQRAADALGLTATGMTIVHGVHGEQETETFLVNVGLPPNVLFHAVKVTKGNLGNGRFDVLIGMDIITMGDFAVTNEGGKTVMTFRCPSSKEIDFVKDLQADKAKALIKHRPASQVRRKKKGKSR